ncbi:MAG: hypothetical protein NUV80_03100 [Candidatus Berkelbacteria bacterium]|nr:hypothetical protein [Candidatus Berkelbacteria bacterium]MCR4307521.1 hypothetical protein [Candidatus Berkelbacteria bacterium]
MSESTSNGPSKTELVVAGVAIAGLAATAYFFFGPDSKKHQKHAKAWAVKMKAEVIEKLEAARDVTKPVYDKIIDSVATEYAGAKKADKSQVDELVADLKKHWSTFAKNAKK